MSETPHPRPLPNDREQLREIHAVSESGTQSRDDWVVVEEPMEIRIVFGAVDDRAVRSLSITMRTPGNDEELAVGFLRTEGIIDNFDQIEGMKATGTDAEGRATGNILRVDLRSDVALDLSRLQRHFFAHSSCGVCGKASLESISLRGQKPLPFKGVFAGASILALPDLLRRHQQTFERTGGLHAAGLAGLDGNVECVREDVGRHNAVDKLVGRLLMDGASELHTSVMVISGRASFEIMQKALVAGIPTVVAVGAPSSLAVDVAREYNMTLVGFASDRRFNIYSGNRRIALTKEDD